MCISFLQLYRRTLSALDTCWGKNVQKTNLREQRPNLDINEEDVVGPVVVWECAAIRPTVANATRTPNIFLNGVGRFAAVLEIAQLYKR